MTLATTEKYLFISQHSTYIKKSRDPDWFGPPGSGSGSSSYSNKMVKKRDPPRHHSKFFCPYVHIEFNGFLKEFEPSDHGFMVEPVIAVIPKPFCDREPVTPAL